MRYTLRTTRRWGLAILAIGLAVAAGVFLAGPLSVRYRLRRARAALAERDAERAMRWLDEAERLDPDRGAIQFWKARAYRRLGRLDRMRTCLLRAREMGHSVEALQREELLALAQAGQVAPDAPEVSALMVDPGGDSLEIYEALVRGYLENYHVGPALVLLDGWEADYPDDPQSFFYRGMVHVHTGKWTEAAAAFRRALERAPGRYDVRLQLARALREDYQYREGLTHYRLCAEHGGEPEALLGRGLCLEALGENDEARRTYLRLLDRVPDHYEALLALGKLDFSFGRIDESVRRLERAAAQRPYEVDARHSLAWALTAAGEKERAREHFEFAVEAQEAAYRVEYLIRRVDEEPSNTGLRYEIGATLLEYGQPSTGLGWLRSVLQLEPHHRLTHLALADWYARQGNESAAAEHRRLAAGAQ